MEKYFKRKPVMLPFLEKDESLEYSISKNDGYCLSCYLFTLEIGEQANGETFTKNEFSNWKKPERLQEHIGGLTFCGHNEYDNSSNQGNYILTLRFLADHNDDIKRVTLKNAPRNNMLIAPSIQKDLVRVCSIETTNVIIRDVSEALFSILIDESHKNGYVFERFIGFKHVTCTTAISLKEALDQLFSKYGLSISRLRKQGYDGASNIQGEFNGLSTLIMNKNESIVAVAKKHDQINSFFNVIANVINKQLLSIVEVLENDDLSSGQGQNPETALKHFGDTCWGSHYGTLLHIICLFPHIISVPELRYLYLMRDILTLSNKLSQPLQRKDDDILNAIKLVEICKKNLQMMRDDG
ncbi:TTF-type domain-containing protein [Citrus sinensis]|uniref:TTF-type domain-containing protein n=1 Tax=Citrus sinensis TaxID=2711 RepID=A0ACB8IK36_CITSI|nr:TTF-type domain-containing protein [Citrus sinensis]